MMKKHIKYFSLVILAIFILASCSSSDKVVTGNFIQKRKYNTGYHLSLFSKHHKKQEIHEQELFAEKIKKERKEELKQNINNEDVYASTSVEEPTKPVVVEKVVFKTKQKKKIVLDFKKEKKIAKKRIKKEVKSLSDTPVGGTSQVIALLLVIFVGALGIHRMYLGYIGIGILQLLTLGGCGIWALIDLIRIITGDLKPNGGDYTDSL